MTPLLATVELLAGQERPTTPRRLLLDIAARLRLHEARERYLLAYGDPFSQRVLRGELDLELVKTT